jgi:hypothetical protein
MAVLAIVLGSGLALQPQSAEAVTTWSTTLWSTRVCRWCAVGGNWTMEDCRRAALAKRDEVRADNVSYSLHRSIRVFTKSSKCKATFFWYDE